MSDHTCHWPGCGKAVPPARWGCYVHWLRLPKRLRDRIWATYRPGQEISKTPSREYVEAAREVQQWIAQETADLFAEQPVASGLDRTTGGWIGQP